MKSHSERAKTLAAKIATDPELAYWLYRSLGQELIDAQVVGPWGRDNNNNFTRRGLTRDGGTSVVVVAKEASDGFFQWERTLVKKDGGGVHRSPSLQKACEAADSSLMDDGFFLIGGSPRIASPWEGGDRHSARTTVLADDRAAVLVDVVKERKTDPVSWVVQLSEYAGEGAENTLPTAYGSLKQAKKAADALLRGLDWVLT